MKEPQDISRLELQARKDYCISLITARAEAKVSLLRLSLVTQCPALAGLKNRTREEYARDVDKALDHLIDELIGGYTSAETERNSLQTDNEIR